jgi:SAM-dependent methyltransferase
MDFKDHFSDRAARYAAFRPDYPDVLFAQLARLVENHDVALDCGTGNGQAAVGLAKHFSRVVATDASDAQIENARPNARIEYRVARAEATGLADSSVDLVTAAQSLHWFDAAAFFAEARRVTKPGGAIAVWGYGDPVLDTIPLHTTLHAFNRGVLEAYWAPERQLLLDGYRSIAFPFREVSFPRTVLEMHWTLPELAGYLRTWSAVAKYATEHNRDPVDDAESALALYWTDPEKRRVVRWPLFVRIGYMSGKG